MSKRLTRSSRPAPGLTIAPVATLEDLLAIPEEARRHELIDGVIVEKGAASGEHGGVQRRLSARIDPFERRPGGRWPGGWWFATEVDVYFDPANKVHLTTIAVMCLQVTYIRGIRHKAINICYGKNVR